MMAAEERDGRNSFHLQKVESDEDAALGMTLEISSSMVNLFQSFQVMMVVALEFHLFWAIMAQLMKAQQQFLVIVLRK